MNQTIVQSIGHQLVSVLDWFVGALVHKETATSTQGRRGPITNLCL